MRLLQRFSAKFNKKESGVEAMPSKGPYRDLRITRYVLNNGSEVLLYSPRMSFLDGDRAIQGTVARPDGTLTASYSSFRLSQVLSQTTMLQDISTGALVEESEAK